MGRIITSVTVQNIMDPKQSLRCDALVDTGASHLVLPSAWKDRLGDLESMERIDVEVADQSVVQAEICGPIKIQIEGFRATYGEVLFLDMKPKDGRYEPLVGYIVLEQSLAAVDMLGHRLIHVKHFDAK
ncbi:MAG TPA: aspartyl protease family protein [Pirellulales bacterium]|jgi:predicted aspartyl protease|nr:aspartyl protease family protein [Pirellulales bacterium]